MKRTLIAIAIAVLLLGALPAQAQPVKAPPCMPLVYGYPVGTPAYARGTVGQHIYWRCTDSKQSEPKWFGFSCAHGSCIQSLWAGSISTITRASAKVSTAKAEYLKHVSFDCDQPQPTGSTAAALCAERAGILSSQAWHWANP